MNPILVTIKQDYLLITRLIISLIKARPLIELKQKYDYFNKEFFFNKARK